MSLSNVFALIDKYGAFRTFTRVTPPGPDASVSVKCMQRNAQEMPLVGDVSQEDMTFFVRHSALTSAGFPAPCMKGDRISSNGSTFVVKSSNELHADTGEVAAYRVVCRGS